MRTEAGTARTAPRESHLQEQGTHMDIMQARTSRAGRVVARRIGRIGWLPVLAALALSGCQVKKTEAPPVSGPSELGLSLELQVSPDVVTMDGTSQSTLTITARDHEGRPRSGQEIRVEIMSGGEIVDFGRLSTKNVTTGSDGRARVTYTAPAGAPSQNSDEYTVVTLIATPAGTDHRNALPRQVDLRLVPQGEILRKPYQPVAKFTYSPTEPEENQEVIFDASSSVPVCMPNPDAPTDRDTCVPQPGSIVSWVWDFGNGRTGSGPSPTVRYSLRGTYVVQLTVTNDRGLTDTTSQEVEVASVEDPTADFVFSPSEAGVNQSVFFDASLSSAAPGRTISSYRWLFGDGSSGSGRTTSHRYNRAGTFTVSLTVTDSGGKTGSTSKTVTVGAGQQPVANFTISPATAAVNQTVFFDGTLSTPPPGRTITRYQWNMGDNRILEGPRVQYAYSRAGSYSVILTVTDSSGATHSATKNVTIN